jgi:protein-L-isoaspartate O-methyltransferase
MEEYARQLRAQGFSREELETMMCRVPRRLLHPTEQD